MLESLPLHPMVVHFPIVLSILLLAYFVFNVVIVKNIHWKRLFTISIFLFVTSIIAMELGEHDEERLGHEDSYPSLEQHEDLGSTVPWLSLALAFTSLIAIYKPENKLTIFVFTLLTIINVGFIGYVSHLGGKLVYQEGAAQAYKIKNN